MKHDWAENSSGKRPHGPWGIRITTWSFLLVLLSGNASLYSETHTISPNSNFAPLMKITNTGNGFKVCSDAKNVQEKFENDTAFLYTTFCVSKGMEDNLSLTSLRRAIQLPDRNKARIEKIDMQDGLYITYRNTPESRVRVLHYFRNEKRAKTSKCIKVETRPFRRIFVEELSSEEYKNITKENTRGKPLPAGEALRYLVYGLNGKATVLAYSKKMEISPQAAYRSLRLLADLGLVTVSTARTSGYEYRVFGDFASDTTEQRRVWDIISKYNDGKNRKDVEAIKGELKYMIMDSVKAYEPARVLFSPDGRCMSSLAKEISGAHKAIDIAMYNFKSDTLLKALQNRRPGVKVRIVLNKNQVNKDMSQKLVKCGVNILYDARSGRMNDKFMIVDKKVVATGSYDWDEKAEKLNEESLLLTQYTEAFQTEFDYLWEGEKRMSPRCLSPPDGVRAYFSPGSHYEGAIIESIQKAKAYKLEHPKEPHRIRIAAHYFTNENIARELFVAKEIGVNVQILLDKNQARKAKLQKYLTGLEKKTRHEESLGGVENPWRGSLEITYDRLPGRVMHDKFAVIGNETIAGSYNWLSAAENKNRENLIVIPGAVKEYEAKFDFLWKDSYDVTVIDPGAGTSVISKEPRKNCNEKGRWVSVSPDRIKLNEDNSYEMFVKDNEVVKFDVNDTLQYIRGPPDLTDDIREIFRRAMEKVGQNFEGPITICKANKNILLNRFFHCDKFGKKVDKKSWIEGGWYSDSCYDYPEDAVKNFYFLDYNNAEMRLNVIIKKGSYFALGGIKNGGEGILQMYVPPDLAKAEKKPVIFCRDRIERFIYWLRK